MQILSDFFILVKDRLNNPDRDDIQDANDYVPYSFIYDIDELILYNYAYRIGDKLLTLGEEERKIYASLLLKEFKELFDLTFKNTLILEEERIRVFEDGEKTFTSYTLEEAKEKNISGEKYIETYYFRTRFGKTYDDLNMYPLMTDCYHFIYIVRNIFSEFGIELKKEAQKMSLEIDYFGKWEAIEVRKKEQMFMKEYKNKDFTLSRQILAFETILSDLLGMDYTYSHKTEITRFIQFMTGKYADSKPKNTEIPKLLGKLSEKGNYNEDCDFVAGEFEKIGLIRYAEQLKSGKNEPN